MLVARKRMRWLMQYMEKTIVNVRVCVFVYLFILHVNSGMNKHKLNTHTKPPHTHMHQCT